MTAGRSRGASRGDDVDGPIVVDGRSFRLPTSRDLAVAAPRAIRFGHRSALSKIVASTAPFRRFIHHIGDGARAWSAEDLEDNRDRMAQADPLAEMRLALTCPKCATQWEETLDIASFVWEEIEARARGFFSKSIAWHRPMAGPRQRSCRCGGAPGHLPRHGAGVTRLSPSIGRKRSQPRRRDPSAAAADVFLQPCRWRTRDGRAERSVEGARLAHGAGAARSRKFCRPRRFERRIRTLRPRVSDRARRSRCPSAGIDRARGRRRCQSHRSRVPRMNSGRMNVRAFAARGAAAAAACALPRAVQRVGPFLHDRPRARTSRCHSASRRTSNERRPCASTGAEISRFTSGGSRWPRFRRSVAPPSSAPAAQLDEYLQRRNGGAS